MHISSIAISKSKIPIEAANHSGNGKNYTETRKIYAIGGSKCLTQINYQVVSQ